MRMQLWQATARTEALRGFQASAATFLCSRCFREGTMVLLALYTRIESSSRATANLLVCGCHAKTRKQQLDQFVTWANSAIRSSLLRDRWGNREPWSEEAHRQRARAQLDAVFTHSNTSSSEFAISFSTPKTPTSRQMLMHLFHTCSRWWMKAVLVPWSSLPGSSRDPWSGLGQVD